MISVLRLASRLLRRSEMLVSSPPTTTGDPRRELTGETSERDLGVCGRADFGRLCSVRLASVRARRKVSDAAVPLSADSNFWMMLDTEGSRARINEPKE